MREGVLTAHRFVFMIMVIHLPSNKEGEFLFMGEAIISRGCSTGEGASGSMRLKTEIITGNTIWTVPVANNNQFSVRIFGGGAGGDGIYGGSGGMMNNDILQLVPGTSISINIGVGGVGGITTYNNGVVKSTASSSGGTSFFGSYLSANGGSLHSGGSGGGGGGNGYQFGGGGVYNITSNYSGYGGGGGGGIRHVSDTVGNRKIGIALGGLAFNHSNGEYNLNQFTIHGGNGGGSKNNINNSNINNLIEAEDGYNTINNSSVFDGINAVNIKYDMCSGNLQGAGKGAPSYIVNNKCIFTGGGGGYGGNGGYNFGGGGGYGANGGNNGGGGGGYGGDGGHGVKDAAVNDYQALVGGGGGGYSKIGKGGNGVYQSKKSNAKAEDGGYAAGGGGAYFEGAYSSAKFNICAGNGGNGICIIQYYALD